MRGECIEVAAQLLWPRASRAVAAIRYRDDDRREGERWRFRSRALHVMSFVPATEYVEAFGPGFALRNHIHAKLQPADWPVLLPTWRASLSK